MRRTRLVLSRKQSEAIVLDLPDGSQVDVVIVQLDQGKVRLLFEAPPEVRIFRRELGDFRRQRGAA